MLHDDLDGRVQGGEEAQKGRDICKVMTDLHCCMAETYTKL